MSYPDFIVGKEVWNRLTELPEANRPIKGALGIAIVLNENLPDDMIINGKALHAFLKDNEKLPFLG